MGPDVENCLDKLKTWPEVRERLIAFHEATIKLRKPERLEALTLTWWVLNHWTADGDPIGPEEHRGEGRRWPETYRTAKIAELTREHAKFRQFVDLVGTLFAGHFELLKQKISELHDKSEQLM